MVRNLFGNSLTGKKEKKAGFKPIPQYIKLGDIVLFSQGNISIETKVLELSSTHILLDDIRQNLISNKGAKIYNAGDGVPWKIEAPTVKRVKEKHDQYIRCDYPKKIELLNRRNNFRSIIPANKRYLIGFTVEDRDITAQLIDISVTGAQLELSIQDCEAISIGAYVEEVSVQIERIFSHPLGFTVKWKKVVTNYSRVGIAFDKISEPERSALSKLIFQFERELA